MKIYADSRLLSLGVVCGTVSRHAGNMRERANQDALFKQLGVPTEKILRLHQVHGDRILTVLTQENAAALQNALLPEADGWILKPNGWGAAIMTADCVPLYIWDEKADLVCLAHAGWRGVAQLLPQQAALEMRAFGARGRLQAYLGPHIQKCCFEVQEDVAAKFDPGCVIRQDEKIFVDLSREIIRQLCEAGLEKKDVSAPDFCTCGNMEQFFSYRRDREKVNMISFIYKP